MQIPDKLRTVCSRMVTKGDINPAERDREATERRLVETIGEMIREGGFEKIGVNAVAERAGVSKILIYRYFGSVDGLVAAYVRQHDFWINFPQEMPGRDELAAWLKTIFRDHIAQLRANPTLRRVCRLGTLVGQRADRLAARTARADRRGAGPAGEPDFGLSRSGGCGGGLAGDGVGDLSGDAGGVLPGLQRHRH